MTNVKAYAETVRENSGLVLLLGLALLCISLGLFKTFHRGMDGAATSAQAGLSPNTAMNQIEMREMLLAPPPEFLPTPQEEKLKVINEHRARYDANPNDPDAEALLRAIGNLYKQSGDAGNAAWAYQTFLMRFPNSTDKTAVCMELAGCYDLLGEQEHLGALYLDMLRSFPKDSTGYRFAEASLRLSDLKLKQRNPNGSQQPGPEGTFTAENLADGNAHHADSPLKLSLDSSASVKKRGA